MTTNPAYSRGPNGGAANRPAPANPAYTRGPNGGGDFNRPGGPNMPGRPGGNNNRPGPGSNHGSAGGRHDFHAFGDFHQSFNASRRFHAPAYRRPPGWYARRWTFGEILPALFWSQNYWLTDYMDYALPPPPYGAVWVRYGNDALLIDQDSGEVITVEYGVFY
jgi:Ni/Co efflux regulator RcnB